MHSFIKVKRLEFEIKKEEIQQIEERYNFKFPIELLEFYLEFNGALMKLCYFDADYDDEEFDYHEEDTDEELPYEVRWLVPLKYGELTFEQIVDNAKDYMDNDMLPIASNQGGDYYYKDLLIL